MDDAGDSRRTLGAAAVSIVRLHDGTQVDSRSEAWRAECEARHVLRMPTRADRVQYVEAVSRRRGARAGGELRQRVLDVWNAQRDAGDE